eukprot:5239699-Pleurochrysis_carterae.AAC.3
MAACEPVEVRLCERLAQQHAVGHVLDQRRVRRHVLEPNRVAHLPAQVAPNLLGDALRYRHGRHATRLRASD